jgi:hypothetical protein
MLIYRHPTVITKAMLLYNTEWRYDHGMVVNYHGKKFYNIGPWANLIKLLFMAIIYKYTQYAKGFVPGKLFYSPMFVGKSSRKLLV